MSLVRKKRATDRHRWVARAYIQQGKSLKLAMAENGFSEAYGRRGIAAVMRDEGFAEAFKEEIEYAVTNAEQLNLPPKRLAKLIDKVGFPAHRSALFSILHASRQ